MLLHRWIRRRRCDYRESRSYVHLSTRIAKGADSHTRPTAAFHQRRRSISRRATANAEKQSFSFAARTTATVASGQCAGARVDLSYVNQPGTCSRRRAARASLGRANRSWLLFPEAAVVDIVIIEVNARCADDSDAFKPLLRLFLAQALIVVLELVHDGRLGRV